MPIDSLIFSIQHFCLHDGPGVRSIVFFKGCPLRCVWCQNPESWQNSPELGFKKNLCSGCNTCINLCPQKALTKPGVRDKNKCQQCFQCIDHCNFEALVCFGKTHNSQSIVELLRPEFSLLKNSGGGVTFSGGEPTLNPEFVLELTKKLTQEGIHITLETCGYFKQDITLLLKEIQLVLFDLKIFDEPTAKLLTGKSSQKIKANLKYLIENFNSKSGPAIWPRLVLIPGITDKPENLTGWGELLATLGIKYLTLVPYHKMGTSKRNWLGLKPSPTYQPPSENEILQVSKFLTHFKITTYAPGDEDWEHV